MGAPQAPAWSVFVAQPLSAPCDFRHGHGGLNTPDAFWRRTTTFSKAMLADGQYPVVVGWNPRPFSNYVDRLFRIRKVERRPVLAALSMPFVLIDDMARSIAHGPAACYMSVMEAWGFRRLLFLVRELLDRRRRTGKIRKK